MSGCHPICRKPALDPHVSPRCRDMILQGSPVALDHSGGKASMAMTLLLTRIVPRDQLVAGHCHVWTPPVLQGRN